MRNNLTEVSHTGELIPELAESWEPSDNAVTWTFKLRKGVEFHNGKTLDAGDVVASINHHRGPDSKSAASGIVDSIADIKTDGKDTVVFTMKEANADYPFILSDFHLVILPAKDGKVDWKSGTGTGGYVLQEFEPGVRTLLKRNPNYWKEGRAHFDETEVLSIPDVNARTNAIVTGEVDIIDRPELKTVHLLQRKPNINIKETSGNLHYSIPMLTEIPPFDNNDVRMALKYAIDRKAMLKTILRDHGYLGNDHPIGRNQRYFASELPQREYDPDKARFHLKKAGLSSLKVDLHAADAAFLGGVDTAILYKAHSVKAGIEIRVIRVPNDGYWANTWMKVPWCLSYWSGRATEDWMFSTAYAKDANWNESHWNHDRFNELLKSARGELDQAKRRAMYVEMQRIVRDEGGEVIPIFGNYVFIMTDKVKHGPLASDWDLDGIRAMERWWFKS